MRWVWLTAFALAGAGCAPRVPLGPPATARSGTTVYAGSVQVFLGGRPFDLPSKVIVGPPATGEQEAHIEVHVGSGGAAGACDIASVAISQKVGPQLTGRPGPYDTYAATQGPANAATDRVESLGPATPRTFGPGSVVRITETNPTLKIDVVDPGADLTAGEQYRASGVLSAQ